MAGQKISVAESFLSKVNSKNPLNHIENKDILSVECADRIAEKGMIASTRMLHVEALEMKQELLLTVEKMVLMSTWLGWVGIFESERESQMQNWDMRIQRTFSSDQYWR